MNTLQYALFDNLLTDDPTDMMAVVQNQDTVDMDMLIDEMVDEGTGLTRPQAKAYSEKMFQLIKTHVSAGRRVKLPVVNIHSAIRGVFTGNDDRFDAARHRVVILVTPGIELRHIEKEIKPEKVKGESPMPTPQYFIDAATGNQNSTATAGSIASVKGYNLKFDPTDREQGLFFVSETDSGVVVRVSQYASIKPSELNFLVPPPLSAGIYRVEVRAKLPRVKTLRSGTMVESVEVG